MTLLVIATVLIVLGLVGLLTLALAAKRYREWDTPPVKTKREQWK